MKLDAVYVNGIARATRFDPSNLEKVIRLRQLLIEFQKHPFLQGRLVLKGGTAVNLFYLQLVRLSVDIDLNSELLTWLVGNVSAFSFSKARVFPFLPIGKADRFRSAPQ